MTRFSRDSIGETLTDLNVEADPHHDPDPDPDPGFPFKLSVT